MTVEFRSLADGLRHWACRAILITDQTVERLWGAAFPDVPRMAIPPGEGSKTLDVYGACLRFAARSGLQRGGRVLAVGGGVVGDLAGFVAATYMRGVGLVQFPTTLLAMVDSSIGGKVGLDLPEGKNLVGAFYPPEATVVSLECLSTLPEDERRNGIAEIVKYGFIADPGLLDGGPLVAREGEELEPFVRRCIEIKSEIVRADERETSGQRAILNFGHTVGHALEAWGGWSRFRHGEAIAIGMVVEARWGESLGITPRGLSDLVRHRLSQEGLPTELPADVSADALLELMARDKKRRGEGLAASLLTGVGTCKLFTELSPESAMAVLAHR